MVDGCQALDLGVGYKYERNFGSSRDVAHIRDGVSLERLFSLAPQAQMEAAARLSLILWTLLQFLIGNSDAHGKNISFFVKPGGIKVAPAYDLVSVVSCYDHVSQELAMALGDEFDLHKVRAYDWAEFAVRCRVGRQLLAREMVRMAKHAYKALPGLLACPEYTKEERVVVAKIGAFVTRQAQRLESVRWRFPASGWTTSTRMGKRVPQGKMIKSS